MTAAQAREWAKTEAGREALARIDAIPDDQIDTSDIPEIPAAIARPATRLISIRLSASDIVTANQLAAAKGLPYQTYIKSLLHQALERERRAAKV